ncbi:hypothetical protein M8C13_32675 [Crossiella sp. SN42]|uniref:hypothetical protein n=1 Tax=Crossiella sp. SN42 TaxID=2944808 RepID=UPI00207CE423|nr:hypothetical protein [Crossiella sp. SN42]MCO1580520.1 hypothetical protein [Crossiella sp. SN42]
MAQHLSYRPLRRAFLIALVTSTSVATAGTVLADEPDQAIACEYKVTGSGTGGWNSPQFHGGEMPTTYYWPHARVWGAPGSSWNPRAGVAVKHLNASGGYWVRAERLQRTAAKCLPL